MTRNIQNNFLLVYNYIIRSPLYGTKLKAKAPLYNNTVVLVLLVLCHRTDYLIVYLRHYN